MLCTHHERRGKPQLFGKVYVIALNKSCPGTKQSTIVSNDTKKSTTSLTSSMSTFEKIDILVVMSAVLISH